MWQICDAVITAPLFIHTIPRCVTFIHDDQINFNIHKNVFRDLYGISTSETWFPKKYNSSWNGV